MLGESMWRIYLLSGENRQSEIFSHVPALRPTYLTGTVEKTGRQSPYQKFVYPLCQPRKSLLQATLQIMVTRMPGYTAPDCKLNSLTITSGETCIRSFTCRV